MNSSELRKKYLTFFEKREHKIIPSASLVPENDPSVLFNTAGMQPLVPYLLGQKHPMGRRLVNAQKCLRTGDIREVGDNRHLTFFEMLGNWSLGDYFKEESIKLSYLFLTDKEEGLGLDKERIYVTVFEGDSNAPVDQKAFDIWSSYIDKNRIYFLPARNNWWSAGDNGPCGPDTEIFYDLTEAGLGDLDKDKFLEADASGQVVEIWNNVFMEYEKKDGVVVGQLENRSVDTGMGLERIVMVTEKVDNVFETDVLKSIINKIKDNSKKEDIKIERIIADHLRASVFIIADGVLPSNTGRGYVLRRLLRRIIRLSDKILFDNKGLTEVINEIIDNYKQIYPEILENKEIIEKEIKDEELRFRQTLEKGLKEFEKGASPFVLYTTYGFPIELTEELASEKGQVIDREEFEEKVKEHQELSRTAGAGMFKGGLANSSERIVRLHTAHHLLLAGLQEIVDRKIKQRGSNITEERLRIDFMFDRKLTEEEKQKVEDWVNDKINRSLPVIRKEMPKEEASLIGAEMEFGSKYPDIVSVYMVEDEEGNFISKEFCGGPHVKNTKEIGLFKILKEEASSAGVRRIKATII
ncbi:MAG TPA: alanine--tRNA ligase [Candidatus Paceibacterota bacterium]|nr:alanine--tRNA ligase [Candidatus Paceibacterota bacterium]